MTARFPFGQCEQFENGHWDRAVNDGLTHAQYSSYWEKAPLKESRAALLEIEHEALVQILEWNKTTDYQPKNRHKRRRFLERRLVLVTRLRLAL